MKNFIISIFITSLLSTTISPSLHAQQSVEDILRALQARLDRIERFEADAKVKIDVEFINIKDRNIKITYQQPDKFTFDAEGLALLPKNGMQMEYMSLIRQKYTALDTGEEVVGGVNTRIIKVIPESDNSDIILAQLWIDPVHERMMRMKTFTRKSGSYLIDFEYKTPQSALADRLVVTFEINNMMFPTKAMSEIMTEGLKRPDSIPKQARVLVEYSNYKIIEK